MNLQENATIDDFYRIVQKHPLIQNAFLGNNCVYKVELQFYDGNRPLRFVFETPQGVKSDQRERRGTIELKTD